MRIFTLTIWLVLSLATASAIAVQDQRTLAENGGKIRPLADGKSLEPAFQTNRLSTYQPPVKKFSFSFNTREWALATKQDVDGNEKRIFEHQTFPVTGMVISDTVATTTAVISKLVVENAHTGGTNVVILLNETRPLGNKKTGFIQFSATVNGADYLFINQHYADQNGNIQVFCFTEKSLFSKLQDTCKQFLSGLTIQ